MLTAKDCNVIDGCEESTEEEYFLGLQRAIDSLSAWQFQGSMGRAMMGAIEAGDCMLATSCCRDYWGNRIPSRTEVQEGTKGSRQWVVQHRGEEWAVMLEGA